MSVYSGVGIIVPSGLMQLNVIQNLMNDSVAEVPVWMKPASCGGSGSYQL